MNTFQKKISYNLILSSFNGFYRNFFQTRRSKFGYLDHSAKIRYPILIKGVENVFLYENTQILGHAKIITTKAKFIMKRNSGAAEGLTVISGNHPPTFGEFFMKCADDDIQIAKDVVVEEDVLLSANVTLLSGVVIGRGAIVGSGAICRNSVVPYAIVLGNPAKVIGFKFTPDEIIEHEKILYPEDQRLSLNFLQLNFKKSFIDKFDEIQKFIE